MSEQENKSWAKSVVSVNLLIFFIYFILSSTTVYFYGDADMPEFIIFFGYLIHAGVLVLIALIKFVVWLKNRQKTNTSQYLLTVFFLLLIGFGACTAMFAVMGGLEGI